MHISPSGFLEEGIEYLFKFGLALLTHFREALLACKTSAQIYEYLRLERRASDALQIVALIPSIQVNLPKPLEEIRFGSFSLSREEIYTTIIRPRIERAEKALAEHSDSSSMSDFDSDDSSDGAECQLCGTGTVIDFITRCNA